MLKRNVGGGKSFCFLSSCSKLNLGLKLSLQWFPLATLKIQKSVTKHSLLLVGLDGIVENWPIVPWTFRANLSLKPSHGTNWTEHLALYSSDFFASGTNRLEIHTDPSGSVTFQFPMLLFSLFKERFASYQPSFSVATFHSYSFYGLKWDFWSYSLALFEVSQLRWNWTHTHGMRYLPLSKGTPKLRNRCWP